MAQDPAPEVGLELPRDEGGQPRGLGLTGRLGEEALEVRLDGPVEHGVLGLAAPIARRGGAARGRDPRGEHGP